MARAEREAYILEREREAGERTQQLADSLAQLRDVLSATLRVDDRIAFDSLRLTYAPEPYLEPAPPPPPPPPNPPTLLVRLVPGESRRYEQQREAWAAECRRLTSEWETECGRQRAEYERRQQGLREKVDERNRDVDAFADAYRRCDPDAIEAYSSLVLERSQYPDSFPQSFRIAYAPDSRQMVVDYQLSGMDVIPTIQEVTYVRSKDAMQEKLRKPLDVRADYQDLVAAIALRTVHELFESDSLEALQTVVFNGHVDAVDPATGKEIQPCLISVRALRAEFLQLNLARIDKVAGLRNLGAQVSRQPSELLAVRPIVEFNMVDRRFVDQDDILSGIESRPNLMEMSPTEFEHLVSNLFTRMGLETRLTRASRDGGVDAVAFDARPVFGGKVVIQAKRYKNAVEVSAVRDLYGTMINEGANKGILVTTSHFGPDAIIFVKDKPVELVDGGALLYLLQEVGVDARIVFPADG